MPVTLKEIVQQVKMPEELVRDILTEKHGIKVTREQMDLIFTTARKMGYDFKKLKIGKRLNLRKDILTDIIKQIESNPKWKRQQIIDYLKKSCEMVERVHKKTFVEEFSD
ncbi:MAG: hypothetical protein V1709_00225 [Planctomycetota bacterium]